MVAKRFFYVCAGLLCLALAYHFGAQSAAGQAANQVVCADVDQNVAYAVVDRHLIYLHPGDGVPVRIEPDFPGTSPVIGCGAVGVLLENGDLWNYNSGGWVFGGNLFGGPTPATQPTWGQLKSRYRPGASAAPQDK